MSDDFKEKLELYKAGKLNENETVEIEAEIEKYHALKEYLSDDVDIINNIKQELDNPITGKQKIGRKINWKISMKIIKLSLLSIIICLIVIPILYISTASIAGKMFRIDSDRFVQEENFAGQFLQMVSPKINNTGRRDHTEFYKQSFTINYITGISRKSPVATIELDYSFGRLKQPAETSDKPLELFQRDSFYALNPQEYNSNTEWDLLEKAPAGTKSQIFVTFKSKLTPQQAIEVLGKQYLDTKNDFIVNMFVDTGSTIMLGNTFSPSYYFEKNRATVSKSEESEFLNKFNQYENDTHKEVFIFGLNQIKQHKNIADYITFNFSYQGQAFFNDIDTMISYVNKNGVQYVGALITGDTKELLKLKNNSNIYACIVEDIVVW